MFANPYKFTVFNITGIFYIQILSKHFNQQIRETEREREETLLFVDVYITKWLVNMNYLTQFFVVKILKIYS